jgi:hypothetical protein
MRRISPAFALAALLLPSTALANEHRIRPSEVLLSDGGDDAVQFIELIDAFAEGFPNSYFLGVYDADGASLGTVTLPDPDPLTPGRVLISTAEADDAFGTEGNAELTVALPAAGQVCFEKLPAEKISCLSWGCINTPLDGGGMFGSAEAAAPPDGQSVQLQGDGTGPANFQLADPTPGAANTAGNTAPACPTDPDAGPSAFDAGTGVDIDAGPNDPDAGGSSGDGDGSGDDDDSGCGCGASSPRSAASGLLLLGMFFLAGRVRRFRGRGTRT